MNNLPPFYIGQKVVYITGLRMPKNSIHIVSDIIQNSCGCYTIGINNIPIQVKINGTSMCRCTSCHQILPYRAHENGWCVNSFRAIEENPQYMTFEKIHELEKEEILINN